MGGGPGSHAFAHRAGGSGLSRLLLETTFLIDTERSGDLLNEWIADEDDAAIAAITVAELRVGVLLATGKTRANRQEFFNAVLVQLRPHR